MDQHISGNILINKAVELRYPVIECVNQNLPMVDEMLIGIFRSEDGTKELIEGHFKEEEKVKIFDDDLGLPDGTQLAVWLKAYHEFFMKIAQGDWIFNIDADDFFHERDFDYIRSLVRRYAGTRTIIGFEYKHFYRNPRVRYISPRIWKWKQPLYPRNNRLSTEGTWDGAIMLPKIEDDWIFVEADCYAYHLKADITQPYDLDDEGDYLHDVRWIQYDCERMPREVRKNEARFVWDNYESLKLCKKAPKKMPGLRDDR